MTNFVKKLLMAATVGIALVACAGNSERPTALMASTETRIEQAKSQDAEKYAPLALSQALQHMQQAQDLIAAEKFDAARVELEKAEIEAKLASVKSQAEKSSLAAEAIQRDLQLLEQQMITP